MTTSCGTDNRRELVLNAGKNNGIDFLEIASDDQRTLAVTFLLPLTGTQLTARNIQVEGGVRVRNISVTSVNVVGNMLTVTVAFAGDFSTYTLRLVTSPTNTETPLGYDPQLSSVEFSFKAACYTDFDCRPAAPPALPPTSTSAANYLAKDYSSFRSLMLERLSLTLPQWTETNPADLQIVLVEMLAYTADRLSYYQDAVATEAYLGTARKRVSVRRHARLLNYLLHEGCNARAWVQIDIALASPADNSLLPAGSAVTTGAASNQPSISFLDSNAVLAANTTVFETMHDLSLRAANNVMSLYSWGDTDCSLTQGATSATVRNRDGAPALDLSPGDFLIFEETISPITGSPADADPSHRHVVRLSAVTNGIDPLDGKPAIGIAWSPADALPFDLRLSAVISPRDAAPYLAETAVARGNVALADHGLTLSGVTIDAADPRLPNVNLTFRTPYSAALAATDLLSQNARTALPAIQLAVGGQAWTAQRDLLSSSRFSTEFVVETEQDGSATLRFGDGVNGAEPVNETAFQATCRTGNGRAGNIGADVLNQIVAVAPGITNVRNPLAASGGTDPESLDDARLFAPQSFRTQQRAVTPDDYVALALRFNGVRAATAQFRWTGSWTTVFLTVARQNGLPVEGVPTFKQGLEDFLEPYRMAGYDLEIGGAVFVPLDLAFNVCVATGYFQSDVGARLEQAFTSFFDAANFSFGQPVYLSQAIDCAMRVPGVVSVDLTRFQRFGKPPGDELAFGAILLDPLEVARLDNDSSLPENGRIEFQLNGGL
jgi:hypothetical protein